MIAGSRCHPLGGGLDPREEQWSDVLRRWPEMLSKMTAKETRVSRLHLFCLKLRDMQMQDE